MRKRQNPTYFPQEKDAPSPLTVEVKRQVRFEEVDALNIVWHGRYPSYIEDGRAAFGEKYGLGYMQMYEAQFLAPIVRMHIEYHNPLEFPEICTIRTALHWSEAARMNFQYTIIRENGQIASTAYTVQVLTNLNKELCFVRPLLIEEFCNRWKENKF